MLSLYHTLLVLHIAGGTLGLICGSIATAVVKGNKMHLLNGKLFFYGMVVTAITALIISNLPGHVNLFLFAVGGFTLYMVTTGYRIVWLKRNSSYHLKPFTVVDYILAGFGICFGLFLVILAIKGVMRQYFFALVPGVFGVICLIYAGLDYAMLAGRQSVKEVWMRSHIMRMIGSLIAAYTAFLVVNIQIPMQWILWILPTVIGSVLITRFIKKYAPPKRAKPVNNINA